MKVAIHQPNYLPWCGYFSKMLRADVFILLDTVQYSKNSYQNRVKIKGQAGEQWLTQPVKLSEGAFRPTNQIEFADKVWADKHLKTLRGNYARAKYFNEHFDQLTEIIKSNGSLLADLNSRLIKWLADCFEIKTRIVLASDFPSSAAKSERLVELVKAVGGDTYIHGKGGIEYQDVPLFEESKIKLEASLYAMPEYSQINGNFIGGLSAVDLLFNCGREGRAFLS